MNQSDTDLEFLPTSMSHRGLYSIVNWFQTVEMFLYWFICVKIPTMILGSSPNTFTPWISKLKQSKDYESLPSFFLLFLPSFHSSTPSFPFLFFLVYNKTLLKVRQDGTFFFFLNLFARKY